MASLCAKSTVRQATLDEIVSLKLRGALPPSSDFHGPHVLGRPPTVEELATLQWWTSGDPAHPSAYMALRYTYDLPETRECLEIVGIDGSLIGTGRLIAKALEIARAAGRRLIGDLPIANEAMAHYVGRFGFRPVTTRWVVDG